VETSRAIADVAGRGAEGVVVRDARARSGPGLWFTPGVVFRFVAVCPDGGLVHRRNGRGAVGRDRWSGRLCGVVLPCCDDRPVSGGGGCRACARGPAVGVIAAGFRCGGGLPAGAGAGAAGCGSRRIGYGS